LQRREEILDVAERQFARGAFDGAKMRGIAAAAHIGDTLLYRYFPSKAAIADALARRATVAFQAFVAQASQRYGKGPFTIERLADFGRAYLRYLEENYNLRCCFHAMPERFAAVDDAIAGSSETLQRLVDSMFARLPAGPRDEGRARALAYRYALEAYVARRVRLPAASGPSLDRYLAATTRVFAEREG
jgi:AcrR family transcriptional regulator